MRRYTYILVILILVSVYTSCDIPGTATGTSRGTENGNPFAEIASSAYITNNNFELAVCPVKVELKALDSGQVFTFSLESREQLLTPTGTALGRFDLPPGTYVHVLLTLKDSCGTGASIRYQTESDLFQLTEPITIQFIGQVKHDSTSRIVLHFQQFVDLLNSISSEDGLRNLIEQYSGEFESAPFPLVVAVQKVFPIFGSNWNDYVKGSPPADEPCEGTEDGYNACIHGAEKLMFSVNHISSCDDLEVIEEQNAFVWECQIENGGVVFRSSRLKSSKSLRALISTTHWRANSVAVIRSNITLAISPRTEWWGNRVVAIRDSEFHELNQPGTIYIFLSPRTVPGVNITADKVGLLLRGDTLSLSPDAIPNCDGSGEISSGVLARTRLVCTGSQKFLWVEGIFDGKNTDGIYFFNTRFMKIKSANFLGTSVIFNQVNSSSMIYSSITGAPSSGLQLLDSSFNYFTDFSSQSNSGLPVEQTGSSSQNRFE